MKARSSVLRFLGAAGTVTGSKFLLTVGDRRVLVDCGLFQGLKQLRLMNWQPLPVDAHDVDDVLLTHAHLDHSGFIPALVREGFRGKVISKRFASASRMSWDGTQWCRAISSRCV